MAMIWVNGKNTDQFDSNDRGLQYGDGFFTTLSIDKARVLNWQAHCQRIENSFRALKITPIQLSQIAKWLHCALEQFFEKQSLTEPALQNCVVKIIITRGVGGVGYQMPESQQPNCLIVIKPMPNLSNQPVTAGICCYQASIQQFAGVKHLNRLENVMARTEMVEAGFAEGLMFNANHIVVSGTQSNLVFYKNGNWHSPKIEISGVLGTTRQSLIKVLSENATVVENDFSLEDILQADELLFCNAVRGIQAVSRLQSNDVNKTYQTAQCELVSALWQDWLQRTALPIKDLVQLKD